MSNIPRLVIFASEESHYSTSKFSSFIGIGEDNVILIKTDSTGRMITSNLERQIQEQIALGGVPIAVIGTAGE